MELDPQKEYNVAQAGLHQLMFHGDEGSEFTVHITQDALPWQQVHTYKIGDPPEQLNLLHCRLKISTQGNIRVSIKPALNLAE